MRIKKSTIAWGAFYIALVAETPAHAYLDPGTGSMLLQLLLGGVVGLLTILKLYWHKIKSIFGKGDASESQPESTTGEDS
jgi:hypothetical protein